MLNSNGIYGTTDHHQFPVINDELVSDSFQYIRTSNGVLWELRGGRFV